MPLIVTNDAVCLSTIQIPMSIMTQNLRSLNLSKPGLVMAKEKLSLILSRKPAILMLTEVKCHEASLVELIEGHVGTNANDPFTMYLNSTKRERAR